MTTRPSIRLDAPAARRTMDFPLHTLIVYDPLKPKKRLGRAHDGGYVIVDELGEYDCLLSGGIADDASFENAWIERHPECPCYAYDGTIERLPADADRKIQFFKHNVTPEANLQTTIEAHADIFLKMDIEGGEFAWLASLRDEHLRRFKQIVIEVHVPFTPAKWAALERLCTTHDLVHLHGNNFLVLAWGRILRRTMTTRGGQRVPYVFECTYVRKGELASPLPRSKTSIPGPLDQACSRWSGPDVRLVGYPYSEP